MLNYIYHILLLKSTYQDINFQSSMNSKFREYSISIERLSIFEISEKIIIHIYSIIWQI